MGIGPVVCSCLSPRRRVFLFKLPWILDVLLVSISRFYCYIMASRNGPVAAGTDGSDFGHRERVANQYRISALSKSRLKICFFFHFLFVFYGLSSLRKNVIKSMSIFFVGNIVFALMPVIFSLGYHFNEFWQLVNTHSAEGLSMWQGFPIAILWYGFSLVAFQVHCFSLYFAHTLISAWKARGSNATKKIN